nr:PREDICTED: protein lifeguard 1 isoform X3 [Bemisia tabaci]XP_018898132.1 PREDICTED: protein lifeguard 1 isoform X3 [Bemisia tabaci]
MPSQYGAYNNDDVGGGMGAYAFSDKTIRLGFIRKVYSILMCQLAITTAFIGMFKWNTAVNNLVKANPGMWWIAMIMMFITLFALTCCGDLSRKSPHNIILLFLFTVAESFLVATFTIHFQTDTVLLAAGLCTVVCFGLTIFAFQTKIDFTVMGGALFIAVLILMLFGLVAIFFPGKTITLVYASGGAFIFSLYLIYDTQMMLGGNHKYSISPEDYVFAVLSLYMDIINIFINILTILGATRD